MNIKKRATLKQHYEGKAVSIIYANGKESIVYESKQEILNDIEKQVTGSTICIIDALKITKEIGMLQKLPTKKPGRPSWLKKLIVALQ